MEKAETPPPRASDEVENDVPKKRPWSKPTVTMRDGLLRVDSGPRVASPDYDTSLYFPAS